MTHRNFQPRKPGLIDQQIKAAKTLRVVRNGLKACPPEMADMIIADFQRSKLRYSDQGDFAGVYRGGFY